ncbi:perphorin-2, partial [Haematococcus lacustris]
VVGWQGFEGGKACVQEDLWKVEFDVLSACAGSIAYSTIDGTSKAPFFQARPYPLVKITGIGKNIIDAAMGTRLCLVLRDPCSSLSSLCTGGRCKFAIFNNPSTSGDNKCCPVRTWPMVR